MSSDLTAHLDGPVLEVARRLLGTHLVSTVDDRLVRLRITEVEAYSGLDDPGAHTFRGPTPRTRVIFGEAGALYVYFSYGMHWCANVVTGPVGSGDAVLLRAGEVIEGREVARARRPAARRDAELAKGPARLASALGIERSLNGHRLDDAPVLLDLTPGEVAVSEISTGPRVGVSGEGGSAEKFPWRFWLTGDPTVSAYRPAVARVRS